MKERIRVLYSFPHKIGASRICYTAWQQVTSLAAAGAEVIVFTGVLQKPFTAGIVVRPTLAWGKMRVSYKLLGRSNACSLHDWIVSRRLKNLVEKIDIIHAWPLGAKRTLQEAARLGIPTVLERPNAHTRFGYETVNAEAKRLGITLPPHDEHSYNLEILKREEEEYRLATCILCPSDFVVKSFLRYSFPIEKLARHTYGYDAHRFHPIPKSEKHTSGLTMLFVGVGTVVKGLHFALEAWLKSPASNRGRFLIAGSFLPEYQEKLRPLLEHKSIQVLGHRRDVPQLMQDSDLLVLPSLTEGFGLVIAEAMGSGCVPVVSEACTDICKHMSNSVVHQVGNVDQLADQISRLDGDRNLLQDLRQGCLKTASGITWLSAGEKLLETYRGVISRSGTS